MYLIGGGGVAKSGPILATPGTVACQASLTMGFSRQEYWSRLPLPSPGDLPNLRIKLGFPALQTDSLPIELQGNPMYVITYRKRTDSEFTTEML